MTTWSKTADGTTSYSKVGSVSTGYTKVLDGSTIWDDIGGLIILCTEGSRELLMTEARTDFLIYSHEADRDIWSDVEDGSTVYTKITDM